MSNNFKEIDELSPSDFEIFIRDLFVASGWSDAVITLPGKEYAHGDGGVDIFAVKNNKKFAIEVKQRSIDSAVDVSALNQLVTGARLANVDNLILVTNSYFTSEVEVRAIRLGVELVDRDRLQDLWIRKHSEIGSAITPKEYQKDVINQSIRLYESGKSKLLIEMATGLGKTYTAAILVKDLFQSSGKKLRVIFIAHQVEILFQSVTSFKNVFGLGDYSFSACFAGSVLEETDFVFACFDSLYSKINSINPELFDIVIVDEAHHTPAKTYSDVVNVFKPKLLIGLTATPDRMDNKGVVQFFGGNDGHIGHYDLAWALRHNLLAFPKYMVLLDDLDDDRIGQLKQGLSISDLDKRLFLHKKDEEVVRIINKTITDKKIENPKAIVFCRSIDHMRYFIQFFELGSAVMVHSRMHDQERRNNIRMFRDGDFKYILVCDLFNEGIDIPETNILVFLRYTGSRTIWLQQLGRGLRKTENKDFVYVLDFVGSLDRLQEIRKLASNIENITIEDGSRELAPDGLHDSTLDVEYNKSAAQVLKLIEDLQYRLNTRKVLLDLMCNYVSINGKLPSIYSVEECFPETSCDQILTHFDSYYRYLKQSVPEYVDTGVYYHQIMNYIEEYRDKFKISPSLRAISTNFQFNGLIEFTESDVAEIVGEISDGDEKLRVSESFEMEMVDDLEQSHEDKLIARYGNIVQSIDDFYRLSDAERIEIKSVFKSISYFIRELVKERKNNAKI